MASMTLLQTIDLSSTTLDSSGIDITGIDAYDEVLFVFEDLIASGTTGIYIQLSNDGGTSFRTGASDYSYGYVDSLAGYTHQASTLQDKMFCGSPSSGSVGAWGSVRLYKPGLSDFKTFIVGDFSSSIRHSISVGECETAEVNDALKLLLGNAESVSAGKIRVYGITYSALNYVPLVDRDFGSSSLSAGGTIDVTGIDAYDEIKIMFSGLTASDAGTGFNLRLSADGGSTFDSTVGDYRNFYFASTRVTDAASGAMRLWNRGAAYGCGEAVLALHNTAACGTTMRSNPTGSAFTWISMDHKADAEINDALRIFSFTGNTTAGRLIVYGVTY